MGTRASAGVENIPATVPSASSPSPRLATAGITTRGLGLPRGPPPPPA